jgi:hypothetical protein
MEGFDREVLNRLPLAEAAWTLLRHVAGEELLAQLFDRHRGTGGEREVRFALLVELVTDALLEHAGSGRRSFQAAREAGRLSATNEAVYGKLRRLPLELSEALVRATARRLRQVLPEGCLSDVPPALSRYQVLVVDGKKLKNLPKRLKSLRGVRGKVLRGKVAAGLLLNEGLIVAMEASPEEKPTTLRWRRSSSINAKPSFRDLCCMWPIVNSAISRFRATSTRWGNRS